MMKKLLVGLLLLTSINVLGALSEPDKAILSPNRNLATNGGFENGLSKWTFSGGILTSTTTAAAVGFGTTAGVLDATGAGQSIKTGLAIPSGLFGRNGVASCLFRTPSGSSTYTIAATDVTNILSSATIPSTTTYTRQSVNFIFPSSGSIELRISAVASNEPAIDIDDCYLGPADAVNLTQVSQPALVGSAYIAGTSSCTWTNTNTSLAAFSTTSACPGPTVVTNPGPGTIQTTDTDLPKFTVNSLPPGTYVVKIYGTAGGNAQSIMAINDGTTTSPAVESNNTSNTTQFVATGTFTYTSAANRSFSVYAQTGGSGTITMYANIADRNLIFEIYRYPTSSETSYRPDMIANSWSGHHDGTCSWTRSNSSYGDPGTDATCALVEDTNNNFGTVVTYSSAGNALPGITFTPIRVGLYDVCAILAGSGPGTVNSVAFFKLWDGTTTIATNNVYDGNIAANLNDYPVPLCGHYRVTNTSAVTLSVQLRTDTGGANIINNTASSSAEHVIKWTIKQIDQAIPAPILVGGVTSSSSGAEGIHRVRVSNGGSAAIVTQDGSWVSGVSRTGAGQVTVSFTSGIFSVAPVCTSTVYDSGLAFYARFQGAPTTASAFVVTDDAAASATDAGFDLICMGPK